MIILIIHRREYETRNILNLTLILNGHPWISEVKYLFCSAQVAPNIGGKKVYFTKILSEKLQSRDLYEA